MLKKMMNNRHKQQGNEEVDAGTKQKFREKLFNMRGASRKANSQVSHSMDTAIIAGGLVGRNAKLIQQDTSNLHNKISAASSATEQITANVRQLNGVIDRQNIAISQTGSAVEEMTAAVNSVAEVTRQKMEAADKLQKVIESGGDGVMKTVKAIQDVTAAVNSVAEIMGVIDNIAAQTNLLAMNAAIEAAHAGELGKGFAVVAAEVRKLAESTAENSKAIAGSLKNIINLIKGAKEAGEKSGATFTNIQKEVEVFVGAFTEIFRSTSELSAGTGQIIDSMEELRDVSVEISGGSKEMAAGAGDIENALTGIKDFSTQLVKDMDDIQDKIRDISGAQSGIVQYTVETNKNIEGFYHDMVESGDLEKEDAIFNYDLIILMHRNWLVQLRAFLDDRKENLKATSEDHQKCDLGKWIYGEGVHFSKSESYKTLEEIHKKFHLEAGEIIATKNGGNKSLAEELYQKLMDKYHTIVSLIDKLRREN